MATATPHTPGETTDTPEAPGVGGRFKAFKHRHHIAFEVAFFFAGFLFDVVLLHRIDSTPLLIHQGTYLVLTSLLIFVDHRIVVRGTEPTGFLGKLASYRLWVMHFFLGTLLNAFLVFYFRSSSGFFAMLFLIALAGITVLNELPRFRARGPVVRVAMLSFATTSFLAYLLPVVWGELRSWQYYLSIVIGSAATVGLWKVFTRFTKDPNWTFRRAVAPGLVVQVFLLVMYLMDAIPPVPLSLKFIDVGYRADKVGGAAQAPVKEATDPKPEVAPPLEVEAEQPPAEEGVVAEAPPPEAAAPEEPAPKAEAPVKAAVAKTNGDLEYQLTYRPAPFWQFWKDADSELLIVPGEPVYVAVRIFAPTHFRDRITYVWERKEEGLSYKHLFSFGSSVSGGREGGFRSRAYIQKGVKAGDYRVRVETVDGREIGRKSFSITLVAPGTDRETAQMKY